MERHVFVFGAGASKDEGLPIQEELLKTYFHTYHQDSFRGELYRYFYDFYGLDLNNLDVTKIPTFEEALGIIEVAIENETTFGPLYSLKKLQTIRNALILSMGNAIENSPLNRSNTHKRLMEKLFAQREFYQDQYGFISFNYDLLLDKALMDALEKDIYVDYGIEFANETIYSPPFEQWESPLGKQHIKFFKPHGSFNWMYCSTCNSLYISWVKESKIFSTGYLHNVEHCLKDHSELSYVMEPPSFHSRYKNVYLQIIWKKTFDVLAMADRIYFIGYALKNADIWFKYLLKRSCFQKQKRFIVVNPVKEEELKHKFDRLLGTVDYVETDFSSFVEHIHEFISM